MINVASASTLANGDIELSVCPSFDATGGTCTCRKDAAGNASPPHQLFVFGGPGSYDTRSAADYRAACAVEAVRLVSSAAAVKTPTPTAPLQAAVAAAAIPRGGR